MKEHGGTLIVQPRYSIQTNSMGMGYMQMCFIILAIISWVTALNAHSVLLVSLVLNTQPFYHGLIQVLLLLVVI